MIEFASNGRTVGGYLALPEGRGPGVIVVQEWWGLVDHIKEVADRLSAEGFVALAPDLYGGRVASEPNEAQKLMMALDIEQAARDLTGAIDYLLDHPSTEGEGVGAVGFCMGGGLVLWLSTLRPEVKAAVPFYGVIPWSAVQPDHERSQAAYLGHFGERDQSLPLEDVRRLEEHLRTLGCEVSFHVYEGADHAFFNDTRAEVYHQAHARLAWERTVTFLRKHLT